jgi:hypothetical protein
MVGSVPDFLNTYSQEGLLAERQSPHHRVNAVAPTSISALEAMAEAGFAAAVINQKLLKALDELEAARASNLQLCAKRSLSNRTSWSAVSLAR